MNMNFAKASTLGICAVCIFLLQDCNRARQASDIETEDQQERSVGEIRLTNLLHTSLEVLEGGEVIVSIVELPPDTILQRHYHPGEEFVYILEGSATIWQKDKPDTLLTEGTIFKVPYKQIHTARTGNEGGRALVFRVHKKGEPERVLVEEE